MIVAGPPVEAARTTTGNRWSMPEAGAGRFIADAAGVTGFPAAF
jgi:hypothetical protein